MGGGDGPTSIGGDEETRRGRGALEGRGRGKILHRHCFFFDKSSLVRWQRNQNARICGVSILEPRPWHNIDIVVSPTRPTTDLCESESFGELVVVVLLE